VNCPSCGHENRANAKYCEECATALKRLCTNCGTELRAASKFCDECAAPVAQAHRDRDGSRGDRQLRQEPELRRGLPQGDPARRLPRPGQPPGRHPSGDRLDPQLKGEVRAILAVLLNTFRETIRDKILYGIVFFAVVLILATFVLAPILLSYIPLITLWDMLSTNVRRELRDRCPLFRDDRRAEAAVRGIRSVHGPDSRVLAFCVMPDHLHTVVLNRKYPLQSVVRLLKRRTTRRLKNVGARAQVQARAGVELARVHLPGRQHPVLGLGLRMEQHARRGIRHEWSLGSGRRLH